MPAKYGYKPGFADHGMYCNDAADEDEYGNRILEAEGASGSTSLVISPLVHSEYLTGGIASSTRSMPCDLCDNVAWCTRYNTSELYLCLACNREAFDEARLDPFGRKIMPQYGTHHMKLKLTGEAEWKELFYGIASDCDRDWPLRADRKASDCIEVCKSCKGMIYRQPSLHPEALKRLALQCGLKIKLKSWLHYSKCTGTATEKVPVGAVS